MDDLISRQGAINALINLWADKPFGNPALTEIKECVERVPSAQPEKRTEKRTETHGVFLDVIDRQAAIDAVVKESQADGAYGYIDTRSIVNLLNDAPSVQPTLHGYNVKHLELIAMILQKEDLPPERITEALTDIGRIVAIVRNEFEETLRKAVEQCKI